MEIQELLHRVDHTLLQQTATLNEIKALCDEAIHYHTASVCIPPSYVKAAADYVGDRMKLCTVIGFPNGYTTTRVKVFETEDAVRCGADEIDMVVNLGWVKDGRWEDILKEIRTIKESCSGRVLKVIVETCLLTREEKVKLCQLVSESGADYIKTSTGFSTGGASREDIALFKANVSTGVKIKAAGGISTLKDAEDMIALGADRLGSSRIIKLVKAAEK